MKEVKVSELSGVALDYAVALCDAKAGDCEVHAGNVWYGRVTSGFIAYRPSVLWEQGGPIIEREGIAIRAIRREGHKMHGQWLAMYDGENTGSMVQWTRPNAWFPRCYSQGPSALIAAMRCYVAAKSGATVSIPARLIF